MSQDLKEPSLDSHTLEHDTEEQKPRGVARIEAVKQTLDKRYILVLILSLYLCSWTYALDSSTTYSYQPYATSQFDRHSMLSTLSIANSIIGAVCKPFIAKISDMTSRAIAYMIILVLYVIGFVIAACSPTISAYVIGSVFIAIGQSGIGLLNSILVADMTPLKWRATVDGLLSTPYLCTTWVAGYIVQNITTSNWRWGYGMFAIITPAALIPAIGMIFWMDHKINYGSFKFNVRLPQITLLKSKATLTKIKVALIEIDALGLILLGFAFSLMLLPCSLYSYANGGWHNPSMIAMEVVGGIFLIMYTIYEIWIAPYPLLPKRVLLNRTFICCVIIDFCYQMGGYFWLLYFSSYDLVVLNLSYRDWTYLNNTETMGLCSFGVIYGLLFRYFRRYKVFQVFGSCIRLIGLGLMVHSTKMENGPSLGVIVAALVLTSIGDCGDAMGTQLAAQACVPHVDLASTISVLSLYTSIGAGVGQAIVAAVWSSNLPKRLTEHVGDATRALSYFESVTVIYALPWGSDDRIACIKAYQDVCYLLFCGALGISCVCLIVSLFQTNFYLGDGINAVEGEQKEDYNQKWYYYIFDFVKHPLR
ncbi:hypothetical protein KL921_000641 [Ogataea angusta]|nr:hypothetical protein KL921_000641 [Ogataea angusta]KAG7826577.1 hypothetical protein KL909_000629 [Ogataea angusta]KAG7831678.1 hypothetical protein KL920_000013 [Ogataea angusta]KAG7851134.1 hypothetical protein KL941_000803 [Ogataea angusta]KAG7863322.1 hypothetical protein KL919_000637 [Ogataea angusta]